MFKSLAGEWPTRDRFAGKVSGVGAQPDPEAILTPPHSKTRFNEVAFTLSALLFVLFNLYHFFLSASKQPIN